MLEHSAWTSSVDLISNTLSQLIEIAGVTGQENPVAKKISDLLSMLPVNKKKDSLGNLTVTLNPNSKPKVMFVAHMDEIGWVVKKIDKQGFLHLYPLGGIPANILEGQWVSVTTQSKKIIPGAVVVRPPHLAGGKTLTAIDVGADSIEETLKMGISPGDPVIIERHFTRMANTDRAIGRCFDNRMGCALLIHLLHYFTEANLDYGLVCVFSTTEEHGMSDHSRNFSLHGPGSRGAWLPAHTEKPDLAFIIDTTTCSDLPGSAEHEVNVQLGKGPVLRFLDDLTIIRPEMRQFMLEVAIEHGIPYQFGFSKAYTDASVVQLAGIPVGVIGIPLRYTHSPAQIIHLPDLLMALKWAVTLVKRAKEYQL